MAIRLERHDAVATIVNDRPEARNAVDGVSARALADAFQEFERDEDLLVAVLWGAGGTFCAGADLKARGTGRGLRLAPDGDGPMGPTRMAFTKPVIAAVEGYAVAGGLELALMWDLRVAAETAIFGVFCRRWGVPLLDGGTVRLPHLIDWLQSAQPDVVCLQELKLEDAKFPRAELAAAGYSAVISGQKTYNGVAILARTGLEEVQIGIPGLADEQRRVVHRENHFCGAPR